MFFRPLYIMAVRSLTYIKNSFVRSYPGKGPGVRSDTKQNFELAASVETCLLSA